MNEAELTKEYQDILKEREHLEKKVNEVGAKLLLNSLVKKIEGAEELNEDQEISALTISTDSEYDDEGGSYEFVSVGFSDSNGSCVFVDDLQSEIYDTFSEFGLSVAIALFPSVDYREVVISFEELREKLSKLEE